MLTEVEARYQMAIVRIGGAAGLFALPESVKKKLRETKDLVIKTKILEEVADEIIRRAKSDE